MPLRTQKRAWQKTKAMAAKQHLSELQLQSDEEVHSKKHGFWVSCYCYRSMQKSWTRIRATATSLVSSPKSSKGILRWKAVSAFLLLEMSSIPNKSFQQFIRVKEPLPTLQLTNGPSRFSKKPPKWVLLWKQNIFQLQNVFFLLSVFLSTTTTFFN